MYVYVREMRYRVTFNDPIRCYKYLLKSPFWSVHQVCSGTFAFNVHIQPITQICSSTLCKNRSNFSNRYPTSFSSSVLWRSRGYSCFSSALNRLLTVVRGDFGRKKRVQVSDLYDNNWQLYDNNWQLFWQKNTRLNKFDIYMETISIKSSFVKFLWFALVTLN